MISPARTAAYDILFRVETQQAYASELLHSARLEKLSPADRGLCTEVVLGTLRWRMRLDDAIRDLSSQKLEKLDAEVLTALRLAAYQIGFLQRVPAHAAVNDSVDLVKRSRKTSAASFVNAVLRKLATNPSLLVAVLAPGPKTVLDLSQLYSHPLWLVERWAVEYGMERAEAICVFDQSPPDTVLYVSSSEVDRELTREGLQLAPGLLVSSARRVVAGDVVRSETIRGGRAWIQDEGSQLVAMLVGNACHILDCCAAPGGKTAIMATRNPQAKVRALEIHKHRAEAMQVRLSRMQNVEVIHKDATQAACSAEFERVLADMPCSGTGTLARNPEIRWRLKPGDLPDLHARQIAILKAAIGQARPGGRIVYSSCSLEPEENAAVVDEVLRSDATVRVVAVRRELKRLHSSGELVWSDLDGMLNGPYLRTLPGIHPCDGFFAAILERR
ncbi:MAG TPA: transcription antitermination factor NusB [Terriglobales bacterium]|nr:transcription antitermination factor NusB [Terriglobales bacterium]